jgi:uncharacterized protein (DUF433 family)
MNLNFVSVDPEVMSGAPVFTGTRVLVQTLIDHIEAGLTMDDFRDGFPSVTEAQIEDFLSQSSLYIQHAMFNQQG